ncbi:hypothetical protein DY000_02044765 [Brassica cretica]|uniref:MSP domain-containing protein n=1 Tax=Brassica cretica TaxID=69181 RepID=A0ABQ7ETF8_BRACR|nr:hypothetical protein DY000_02044765 [Brassica cretica]
MNVPLLDIQPRTLKFVVDLKKQSTCVVQLTNTTNLFVAFKVKTTSPKKYCVRPNVGVVAPKSSCEFSGMMATSYFLSNNALISCTYLCSVGGMSLLHDVWWRGK